MIVQRGFRRPPSFHEPRLRQAPLGHFYDVMTNGFGVMPDYAAQVVPQRPLGDCGVHTGAAVQPERAGQTRRTSVAERKK